MFHPSRTGRTTLLALLCSVPLAAQTPARYTITRDLRIDAAAANLSPVTWLAVSRTGTIAVGQAQDNLIRFFDAAGQSLGTFGRAGAGPGEFRSLNRYEVGWIGDTLWAGDYQLQRFALITPDRKLLRTVPAAIAVKSLGDSAGYTQAVGAVMLYSDGSQLLDVILPSAVDQRPAWARDPRHADTRLTLINVAATNVFRRLVSYEVYDDCGIFPSADYALCGHPRFGIDPTGEHMAWLAMSYAGPDSGSYRVELFSQSGATVYDRKYPFKAEPIPQHIRDSLVAKAKSQRPTTVPPALAPRFGPPTIYPGAESVIVGTDGTAWVELRATAAGIPWVILSPRGDVTGSLMAPANVKLMVIGRGEAWGTEKDADDLESVVRFRVARAK